MEIGLPSVEDVTLGLRPRVTCSTSGRHISMSHSPPSVICQMFGVDGRRFTMLFKQNLISLFKKCPHDHQPTEKGI